MTMTSTTSTLASETNRLCRDLLHSVERIDVNGASTEAVFLTEIEPRLKEAMDRFAQVCGIGRKPPQPAERAAPAPIAKNN